MDKKAKEKSVFKKLSPYLGSKKSFMPIAMIFSATSSLLSMLPFYYIWLICKELFKYGTNISLSNVSYYGLMALIFAVSGFIVYFIGLMISHWAAFEVEFGIKREGFNRLMNMPLGFFNINSSGKIRKIINDGAAQTHTLLAHQLPDLAGSIVTPAVILIMFFYMDYRLGIAALVPVILSFVIMSMMMTEEGKKMQKKYYDSLEEMSNEAVEYVRAIPVVKTFGQSVKSFTRFYNSIVNYKDYVVEYTVNWSKSYSLYLVIIESTAFFLVPICIILISRGNDLGTVLSNFILYIVLAPQFSLTMMKSMYYQQQKMVATQAIDRYNDLFNYKDMEYKHTGEKMTEHSVEFKNVSFSYDGDKDVLKNISFKVEKGQSLALVGKSGAGKTTIARLAARFWDVTNGKILLGDRNIKDYTKEELMDNISFVFQNTQLFKTTLRENISFGRDVSDEILINSLKNSRSKEIIDKLDDGLDTMIGNKGTYLSGGEQQRISLARAFIKDAPIVLLDEATAFADPENEHLIQEALRELSKGKTTIMIAHRMSTVKNADNIAVIDNGEIVEYGNHESLMEKNGVYKKMWDEYKSAVAWKIKKGA